MEKRLILILIIIILLSSLTYAFSLNDFLTRITTAIGGCSDCEGRVTELTLEYTNNKPALITIFQKEGELVFNNTLNPNEQFSITGVDKKNTLSPWIDIFIDNIPTTRIHTSCSEPIGPGLVSGYFIVISGKSKIGGNLCPVNCIDCQSNSTIPPEEQPITNQTSNITLPIETNQSSNITIIPITNQTSNASLPEQPINETPEIITPPSDSPEIQQPEIIERSPTKMLQIQKLLKFPQRESGGTQLPSSDSKPIIEIGKKLPPIEETKNRIIDLAFVVDAWVIFLLIVLAVVTEKKIYDHNKKLKEKYKELKPKLPR